MPFAETPPTGARTNCARSAAGARYSDHDAEAIFRDPPRGVRRPDPTAQVVHQYAVDLDANYQAVIAKLVTLNDAVGAFVAAPSADGFNRSSSRDIE